jgi:membrane protein
VLDSALAQFPVIGDQITANIRSFHGSTVGLVIGILGCFSTCLGRTGGLALGRWGLIGAD